MDFITLGFHRVTKKKNETFVKIQNKVTLEKNHLKIKPYRIEFHLIIGTIQKFSISPQNWNQKKLNVTSQNSKPFKIKLHLKTTRLVSWNLTKLDTKSYTHNFRVPLSSTKKTTSKSCSHTKLDFIVLGLHIITQKKNETIAHALEKNHLKNWNSYL